MHKFGTAGLGHPVAKVSRLRERHRGIEVQRLKMADFGTARQKQAPHQTGDAGAGL